MIEPIKKGDLAYIFRGLFGEKGPNVGLIVTVGLSFGEDPEHGRIVRVHGEGLTTENGTIRDNVLVAVSWLRKINPPPITKPDSIKAPTLELDLVD